MSEEQKINNTVSNTDVRISHRNVLWFLYRALAERLTLSEETEGKCCHRVASDDSYQE